MGSNRRYAEYYDRKMDQRILEMAMRDDAPHTLVKMELELDTMPLTRTPVAVPVKAWVRYGSQAVKVDAEAVAWTPKAVAIRWKTPSGEEHRAWVWASAVEGPLQQRRSP